MVRLIPRTVHADATCCGVRNPSSFAVDLSPNPITAMHFEHSTHGLGWHIEAAQLFEHARVFFSFVVNDLPH
jgi:hypothetical protein